MSYDLYCLPGACSMAVHVILNEMEQDVNVHLLTHQEMKAPEFLKINPRGQVPLLMVDDQPLREGAAQIIYLCETHNSPLLPKSGFERAQALQWLMFCNASLHPAYGRTMWLARNTPEGEFQTNAIAEARKQIQGMWDQVEQHLAANGPYLCGKEICAADILMCVIANWSPQNYKFGPKCKALFASVTARPAYQQALADENVEYKAAA